ncbi:MAG: type II toxin-antitoxin system HicB family antitoxin [Planctomycetota bacterium]|nr:type II toxin-antitoxin system HicB family antitoxin [Planctomycetota bacterium]
MKLLTIIEQDEDDKFVARCPALPGCVSQGDTRTEARANILDAIQGHIASLRKHGEPIPPSITEEVVEVEL